MIAGCSAHQALIERAMGPDASDADLELYADRVATCPACQRLLAVGARVHPGHLHHDQPDEHEAIAARVALDDAGVERLMHALETPGWRWEPLLMGALLAAAAVLLWVLQPAEVPSLPHLPSSAPVIEVASTGPELSPVRQVVAAPAVDDGGEPDDGVAEAEVDAPTADWEPPPFVDLRGASRKGSGVRDLQLAFEGTPAIGDAVRLVVQSSTSEAVSVCVAGVENGVVWRGAVPRGRTVLTVDERALRYRFPRAGGYRFTLALGDTCVPAVHRVQVSL